MRKGIEKRIYAKVLKFHAKVLICASVSFRHFEVRGRLNQHPTHKPVYILIYSLSLSYIFIGNKNFKKILNANRIQIHFIDIKNKLFEPIFPGP